MNKLRSKLNSITHIKDGGVYVQRHFDLLRNKYELVNRLQPASICEIGIRCGYSLMMFLEAVGHNRILGIDNCCDEHGGFDSAVYHAWKQLNIHYPDRFAFWLTDSQKLEPADFPFGDFEFWHIDGDHTVKGTWHDLCTAFSNGCKWALVDDYNRIAETKMGTDEFVNDFLIEQKIPYSMEVIDDYQLLISKS